MEFIDEKYKRWEDFLVRIALGVVLMSAAEVVYEQRAAHFLCLAQGGIMRPRDGNTYLYENGAFRLSKGAIL